jgi:hypothetical protein
MLLTWLPGRRRFSFALAILSLAAAGCTARSARSGGPSHIRQFPSDLADPRLELAGIYTDGWTAPASSLSLYEPDGRQVLTIRGVIPKIERTDFKTDVELRLDDAVVARKSIGLGSFSVQVQVPLSPGKHRIGIVFTSVQLLPAGDGRPVGTLLSFAGFEPDSFTPAAGAEIISNNAAVRLGSGWHNLETFGRDTSREADNDAQLLVSAAQRGTKRIGLVLESATDPDGPVVLKVLDASGRQVDAAEVSKHSTVEIFLPVEAGRDNDFRFHLDQDQGQAVLGAPPQRPAFRVYRIDAF